MTDYIICTKCSYKEFRPFSNEVVGSMCMYCIKGKIIKSTLFNRIRKYFGLFR